MEISLSKHVAVVHLGWFFLLCPSLCTALTPSSAQGWARGPAQTHMAHTSLHTAVGLEVSLLLSRDNHILSRYGYMEIGETFSIGMATWKRGAIAAKKATRPRGKLSGERVRVALTTSVHPKMLLPLDTPLSLPITRVTKFPFMPRLI